MTEYLVKFQTKVYAQVGIFLVLVALYFMSQRKLPTYRLVSFAMVRIVAAIVVFIYLFLNWSSEVNPTLRNASVLGMFVVNLYMLWQVVLTRMELPYREALEACGQNPDQPSLFQDVIRTGKRFYNMRYFWQALFSGSSIKRFLHGIALEQLRFDFKRIFQQHGVSQDIINFAMTMAFLRRQLAKAQLPPEVKESMERAIAEFSQHPWIKEEMNNFLAIVVETPEELYGSEWAEEWQKIISAA
jgi:4-amino-4-deoxy-L-arabinose transferase-like glycosyltransferase